MCTAWLRGKHLFLRLRQGIVSRIVSLARSSFSSLSRPVPHSPSAGHYRKARVLASRWAAVRDFQEAARKVVLFRFDCGDLIGFKNVHPAVRVENEDSNRLLAFIDQNVCFAVNVDPASADCLNGEGSKRLLVDSLKDAGSSHTFALPAKYLTSEQLCKRENECLSTSTAPTKPSSTSSRRQEENLSEAQALGIRLERS